MLELIFLLPFCLGLATLVLPVGFGRRTLPAVAAGHLLLTLLAWGGLLAPAYDGFFCATPIGMLVLLVTSFIFLLISVYALSSLKEKRMAKEITYLGCMQMFLGTMSMVALADQPIVLWIAIEATTLVSAPLIFIHRSKEALEATWKYVLICSVGIALALLGCFFITLSVDTAALKVPLTFTALNQVAGRLDPLWLKTGFIFIVVGFGTKMGLAPMHTWLPDAHSQAPSPASALLSGALLNCAFIGIYKTHALLYLAGLGAFSGTILIGFGLASMLVAGIFITRQADYKRLLAYSSIENMGVIAFGVGIGGFALYGAILHLIHHSLLKSSLFLSAGNILQTFKTKLAAGIEGMIHTLPGTFLSFFAGFIGISGLPPFGIFISELLILIGAFRQGHIAAAATFIFCLLLVLSGAAAVVSDMSFTPGEVRVKKRERFLQLLPPYVLLLTSVVLSIWMPGTLRHTIAHIIQLLGGTIHG